MIKLKRYVGMNMKSFLPWHSTHHLRKKLLYLLCNYTRVTPVFFPGDELFSWMFALCLDQCLQNSWDPSEKGLSWFVRDSKFFKVKLIIFNTFWSSDPHFQVFNDFSVPFLTLRMFVLWTQCINTATLYITWLIAAVFRQWTLDIVLIIDFKKDGFNHKQSKCCFDDHIVNIFQYHRPSCNDYTCAFN